MLERGQHPGYIGPQAGNAPGKTLRQVADIAFVGSDERRDALEVRKAIRLSDRPGGAGGDGIYRYDRAALMAALLRAGEELAA